MPVFTILCFSTEETDLDLVSLSNQSDKLCLIFFFIGCLHAWCLCCMLLLTRNMLTCPCTCPPRQLEIIVHDAMNALGPQSNFEVGGEYLARCTSGIRHMHITVFYYILFTCRAHTSTLATTTDTTHGTRPLKG